MDTLTHSMNNMSINTETNWEDILVSEMSSLHMSNKPKLYSEEELNNLGPLGDIVRKIYSSYKSSSKLEYVYSKSKCGKFIYKRLKK